MITGLEFLTPEEIRDHTSAVAEFLDLSDDKKEQLFGKFLELSCLLLSKGKLRGKPLKFSKWDTVVLESGSAHPFEMGYEIKITPKGRFDVEIHWLQAVEKGPWG